MPYPKPLLLTNGVIHTMQDNQPPVEALAIDTVSGTILAVGDETAVRAELGVFAAVEVIDLRGRAVVPGLIDAHTHLLATAQDRADVDLAGTADAAEAVARVVARAATVPQGTWIVGRHWNQQFWPGGQYPTRALLDAAIPDHPVLLWTHSQHAMWVNSLALARAGISAATVDPAGGAIARDAQGEPTGMLFENAAGLVDDVFEMESAPDEREVQTLRQVLRDMAARGLTGAHVMESARSLRMLQQLHDAGELPLRISFYLRVNQLEPARAVGLAGGFGDDWLRIAGIKLFTDGALGTHTAAMLQPYTDDPGNTGILTTPADQMEARVSSAVRGGLGVAIHAIGDRAVRVALDGIERAQRIAPPGYHRRFRIEHIQLAAADDITRMARLGVVGSVQPFHAVSDRDVADRSWGPRAAQGYAYRTLAEAGVSLAFGSDVPIETCDPWRILHAAIARTDDRTPDRPAWHGQEALSPMRGLWAYTAGAAYAGGDEQRLGRLAPGMLADCVVVETDPLHAAIGELARMPVVATLVGGRVVYGGLG